MYQYISVTKVLSHFWCKMERTMLDKQIKSKIALVVFPDMRFSLDYEGHWAEQI